MGIGHWIRLFKEGFMLESELLDIIEAEIKKARAEGVIEGMNEMKRLVDRTLAEV